MNNILINCNGCPCLNNDEETGINCNLGYTTRYEKFPDDKWYEFSPDCDLALIRTRDRDIYPELLTLQDTDTDKVILIGGTYDTRLMPVPNPPAPQIRIAIAITPKPTFTYFAYTDPPGLELPKVAGKVTYDVYDRGREQPRIYFYSHTETIP